MAHKSHPWHGIDPGADLPEVVTAFIEIVPSDTVKYEIDKVSGYLKIDRPQRFSNVTPALYGFVPRTYCGESIAAFCMEKTGRSGIVGDGDPLDIMVLTEHTIPHGDILVQAIPIGGLRMIDKGEADDKIIAVLVGDAMFGRYSDVSQLPPGVLERFRHYFLTYKQAPDSDGVKVEIPHVYGREEAHEVIMRSREDYRNSYES